MCSDFTKKGKDAVLLTHNSFIHHYLPEPKNNLLYLVHSLLVFVIGVLLFFKGLVSVEGNVCSCLLSERERVQGFTSLYSQTEKKSTASVDALCIPLPSQKEVQRSTAYV